MSIVFYKKITGYLTSYILIDFQSLSCYNQSILLCLFDDHILLGETNQNGEKKDYLCRHCSIDQLFQDYHIPVF